MDKSILKRAIPTSGELLPVVGIGTWKGFDISGTPSLEKLGMVLEVMHEHGGTVIDTSPMYGNAEEVIGKLTGTTRNANDFFYATKVWTEGKEEGIRQMETSMQLMKRSTIDLMQIHNLMDWKTHIETLKEWKQAGKIRYIGITHYTDGMHAELQSIIEAIPIDFVQFNYSIVNRNAENGLLPLAKEKGVATLINRPLGEGNLINLVKHKPLPEWIKEYGITSWGQFFLKFIISHPAVTCVIPGTGNPEHMKDNMMAGYGRLPYEKIRKKMAAEVAAI